MKGIQLFLSGLFLVGILFLARAAARSTPALAAFAKGGVAGVLQNEHQLAVYAHSWCLATSIKNNCSAKAQRRQVSENQEDLSLRARRLSRT
jgi:hypothetical protein